MREQHLGGVGAALKNQAIAGSELDAWMLPIVRRGHC